MDQNARNAIGVSVVVLVIGIGAALSLRPWGKPAAQKTPPARGSMANDVARLKNAYFSKDGDPDSASPLKNQNARPGGE